MSSVIDEDTARSLDAGKQTVAGALVELRDYLRYIFVGALLVFLLTVLAMRLFVWDYLEAMTISLLPPNVADATELRARTPFDVFLMQVKIGAIAAILTAIPLAAYFTRQAIIQRIEVKFPVTRTRIYLFIVASILLVLTGLSYAYTVFFPVMFLILADQAYNAGVTPSYGIVRYTDFMLLLTLSFALAAQLPLLMGVLSYSEIVRYETFRDKWRYAVLGIFVIGAAFSPPDPFTQVMWAAPLVALYVFSLGVAKVVANYNRAQDDHTDADPTGYRRVGYLAIAAVVATFVSVPIAFALGAHEWVNATVMSAIPAAIQLPILGTFALPTELQPPTGVLAQLWFALRVALVAGGLIVVAFTVKVLREPVIPRYDDARGFGDPSELDLSVLDASGIRAAPEAAFLELSEEEALSIAREAMEADDPDKAEAIFDRFDEAQEAKAAAEADDAEGDADRPDNMAADAAVAGDDEGGDVLTGTAAGMMSAFTEGERTEDDIGGYLYDIRFILDTLRSKLFRIFAVFIGTFGITFALLYGEEMALGYDGLSIGSIMAQFTSRVDNDLFREWAAGRRDTGIGPPDDPITVPAESTDILIALHPIEVILFMVKFALVVAIVFTLPVLLYYAWPAIRDRFLPGNSGDQRMFLVWGFSMLFTLVGGSAIGFLLVAPEVVSFLVADALESGMVISYRLQSFLWVIFFLTVGVGIFLTIPVTMSLFHFGGIVSYDAMATGWRGVALVIFIVMMFATSDIVLMFALALPTVAAYMTGLGVLWLLTLPSRLLSRGEAPAT